MKPLAKNSARGKVVENPAVGVIAEGHELKTEVVEWTAGAREIVDGVDDGLHRTILPPRVPPCQCSWWRMVTLRSAEALGTSGAGVTVCRMPALPGGLACTSDS